MLSNVAAENLDLTLRFLCNQCSQSGGQADLPRNWNAKAQKEKVKTCAFLLRVKWKHK